MPLHHTPPSVPPRPRPLPLPLLKSGQFLCVAPDCQGGLILQKQFYTDFVGPGAALGCSFDIHCTAIYAWGPVQLQAPTHFTERQQAFQRRMVYSKQLGEIARIPSPLQRAYRIVHQLCEWMGEAEARQVPLILVSQLAGVLPQSVQIAWHHYGQKGGGLSGTPVQSQRRPAIHGLAAPGQPRSLV